MAKDWARMEEKARILIVDDNESTCRSMKVIFEAKNYDTDIVHTGQEAIAAIKKRSFNLAVLDIRLPDVDGITLLEQLSKMNADLGIIMITGYASMETAVDALNKGAAAYITKPLNMDEVLITVNKALEKQRLTRAKLRAEAALQEERDRAQKYLDIAGVMFVCLDLDGAVTLVNRSGCEILGYESKEIIGKDWFKTFIPKRLRKEVYRAFSSLMKSDIEPVEYFENPILTKAGEERVIAWHNTMLTDESGKIVGTLSSGEDITERMRAEEALKESENLFRDLAESTSDWIWEVNSEGVYTLVSGKIKNILGYTVEEVLGRTPFDLMPSDESEKILPIFSDILMKKERIVDLENWNLHKDGHLVCLLTNGVPILDEEGNLLGYRGVDKDITERKKAEKALKESEAKWRSIAEHSPDHIKLLDLEGKILFINRTAPDLTIEEVIGQPVVNFTPPEYHEVAIECFNRVVQTGEPDIYYTEYVTKDGEIRHFEVRMGPVVQNDEVVALVSSSNDITNKKRSQDALIKSEERYRSFFDNLLVGFLRIRIDDNRIVFCNEVTAHMFGYDTPEEAIDDYLPVEHFVDPEFRARKMQQIRELGEKQSFLTEMTKRNGERIWVEIAATVREEEGCLDAIMVDVTERRKAEEEIKYLASLTDKVSDAIISTDSDFMIRSWNSGAEWIYGWTAEEAIGKRLKDFLQTETIGVPAGGSKKQLLEIGRWSGEALQTRKDGSAVHVYISASLLVDKKGTPTGAVIVNADITDSVRTEKALKDSEERMTALFKGIPVPTYIWKKTSDDFILSDYNNAADEISNGNMSKVLGAKLSEYYSDRLDLQEAISKVYSEKILLEQEIELAFRYTGEHKHLNEKYTYVPPDMVLVHTEDITEKKQAEADLKFERERFISVLDALEDGIYVVNRNYDIEYTNQVIEREFGPVAERKCYTYLHDRPEPCPWCKNDEVFAGNTVRWQWHSEKNDRYYELLDTPMESADGSISKFEILRDITERKRAERAVEERVKELTCLLGTSQLASKSELAVDAFLKGVVEILPLAWSHAEITCARILLDGLVFPTSNFKETKWKQVADITVGTERRGAVEVYYLEQRPDFDEGPFLKEERVLIDGVAEQIGNAVGRWQAEETLRELTEELEQRVKKRTQDLVDANQELEAFAYSVSHDLRSPLRGIAGFSRAVIEDYSDVLDETGRDYLQRMHDATVRMSELIDDILSLSRVSREEMYCEEIDMTALARTIADELRSQEPGRKAKLVISKNIEAYGDKRLLGLVLENLLWNAWKFTSKQQSARIEFGATEQENETVFFVRDNGAGFDMKYVDKLFNVFQRLHHADEFAGTGIGLAIVKRIISRHGGRAWAEGTVGKGATFYFMLPSKESEVLT